MLLARALAHATGADLATACATSATAGASVGLGPAVPPVSVPRLATAAAAAAGPEPPGAAAGTNTWAPTTTLALVPGASEATNVGEGRQRLDFLQQAARHMRGHAIDALTPARAGLFVGAVRAGIGVCFATLEGLEPSYRLASDASQRNACERDVCARACGAGDVMEGLDAPAQDFVLAARLASCAEALEGPDDTMPGAGGDASASGGSSLFATPVAVAGLGRYTLLPTCLLLLLPLLPLRV